MLPDRIDINKYTIKLMDSKQPSYGPIYSLGPVELKNFKTYIETPLANGFIQPSKFLADVLILFICKPDASLYLCVNYWELNNFTIKNWYALPLIGESLDFLK